MAWYANLSVILMLPVGSYVQNFGQLLDNDGSWSADVLFQTTDGPNGARGESYVSGIKAACFPCGTNLGATFDRKILYQSGVEVARESKTKGATVLLAPTLNVIRHPLGKSVVSLHSRTRY